MKWMSKFITLAKILCEKYTQQRDDYEKKIVQSIRNVITFSSYSTKSINTRIYGIKYVRNKKKAHTHRMLFALRYLISMLS